MESYNAGRLNHLLFDDWIVSEREGFVPESKEAKKAGPVILQEKRWECINMGHSTIIEDGGEYKMWYSSKGEGGKEYHMCMSTSSDGINWDRPNFGKVSFEGSRKNNIVLAPEVPFHGGTVFKDPNAPAGARYKMICGLGPYDMGRNAWHYVNGAYSPDGIDWKFYESPICRWYTDTRNVAFWDDEIKKYVAFLRWDEGTGHPGILTAEGYPLPWGRSTKYRAICRTESADFTSFPDPRKILEPDEKDKLSFAGHLSPKDSLEFDKNPSVSPISSQPDLYNTSAMKYPFGPSSYFIFPSIYFHYGNFSVEPQLATSRNGIDFSRWRKPFVSLGTEGSFDSRQIYMDVGIIDKDDEVWMYYMGTSEGHAKPGEAGKNKHKKYAGGIGRIILRKDGFVAQTAKREKGRILTKPMKTDGRELLINMNAGAGGWMKVSLLDADKKTIRGFGPDQADFLWGNSIHKKATWKGRCSLPKAQGNAVRLLFEGQNVELYSFRFA